MRHNIFYFASFGVHLLSSHFMTSFISNFVRFIRHECSISFSLCALLCRSYMVCETMAVVMAVWLDGNMVFSALFLRCHGPPICRCVGCIASVYAFIGIELRRDDGRHLLHVADLPSLHSAFQTRTRRSHLTMKFQWYFKNYVHYFLVYSAAAARCAIIFANIIVPECRIGLDVLSSSRRIVSKASECKHRHTKYMLDSFTVLRSIQWTQNKDEGIGSWKCLWVCPGANYFPIPQKTWLFHLPLCFLARR